MSFMSRPRLGMAPGISSNTSVSEVRFSSRNRSWLPDGKWGRQIVLNPVPVQMPGSAASGPSGSSMLLKGRESGSATAGTGSKAKWARLMGFSSGVGAREPCPGAVTAQERSARPVIRRPSGSAVETVDHVGVLGVDDASLELEGGSELLGLGGPLDREQLEGLHLLGTREAGVGLVDRL